MQPDDPRSGFDADGVDLSGFDLAQPSENLRTRVLALQPATPDRSLRAALRVWWPAVAALLVIAVTVLVNRRIESDLARSLGPPSTPVPAELQPYGPTAKLPINETSWAALRSAEVTP